MPHEPIVNDFTEDALEEYHKLTNELSLTDLAEKLEAGEQISEDEQTQLASIVVFFNDMVYPGAPKLLDTVQDNIESASQMLNLSRLIREKGLARFYNLVRSRNDEGELLYKTVVDQNTGELFDKQEDFIKWFCFEAKVSRALVFQRLRAYERLAALGHGLDSSFKTILRNPASVQKALKLVGEWDKDKLIDVPVDTARKLADKYLDGEQQDRLLRLADKIDSGDFGAEDFDDYLEATLPAIAGIVEEVATSNSVKETMDFVTHDLLGNPEVQYYWDKEGQSLEVRIVRTFIDQQGNSGVGESIEVTFVPDLVGIGDLPKEILEDLFKRLPIKNRKVVEELI